MRRVAMAVAARHKVGKAKRVPFRRERRLSVLHYHGNVSVMAIAQSKVTAQGQISVPAEIRKKLGIGPGSVLEWDEQDDQVVVRRVGRFSCEDVHNALFPKGVKGPSTNTKDAIRAYIRKRHARD